MQRGMAGAAIVTVVLMATIFAGYIVSENTLSDRITYEGLTDLTPIVSAGDANEFVEYSPRGNVTGWTGSVQLPITTDNTAYIYQAASTSFETSSKSYTTGAIVPSNATVYGYSNSHYVTVSTSLSGYLLDSRNPQLSYNGNALQGGYLKTDQGYLPQYEIIGFTPTLNGAAQSYLNVRSLADLTSTDKNVVVQIPSGASILHNYSISLSSTYNMEYKVTGSVVLASGHLFYQKSTNTWRIGTFNTSTGVFTATDDRTFSDIAFVSTSAPSATFNAYYMEAIPPKYVLPNTAVTLTGQAVWSNTATNGVVQFITTPGMQITAGSSSYTVPVSVPFERVLVTLDALEGVAYMQGLMDYSSPLIYTLLEYQYNIPAIRPVVGDLNSLTFNGSGDAYILRTVIAMDPNGLLWSNPTMALDTYFPEELANGARVLFNSFVTLGNSITINGQSFTITNDKLVIGDEAHSLAGLAVDYRADGHTYLVFTQDRDAEYDLGATTSKTISATGVWYYQSELFKINTRTDVDTNIIFGAWDMSLEMSVVIFVGLLVLGSLIAAYWVRGGMGVIDWIIVGAAGLVAITLL